MINMHGIICHICNNIWWYIRNELCLTLQPFWILIHNLTDAQVAIKCCYYCWLFICQNCQRLTASYQTRLQCRIYFNVHPQIVSHNLITPSFVLLNVVCVYIKEQNCTQCMRQLNCWQNWLCLNLSCKTINCSSTYH